MIQYLIYAYIFVVLIFLYIFSRNIKYEKNMADDTFVVFICMLWLPILVVIVFYYIYRGIKWYIDCWTGNF